MLVKAKPVYVADPEWRRSPLIGQIPCTRHDPDWWDSDNPNAEAATKLCALQCPLRRDCAVEGMRMGDIGVIRGGYRLTSNTARLTYCHGCGVKSVRQGKTDVKTHCSVCTSTRQCKGCGIRFYAVVRGSKTPPEYCTRSCKLDQMVGRLKAMRAKRVRAAEEQLARIAPLLARLLRQRSGVGSGQGNSKGAATSRAG